MRKFKVSLALGIVALFVIIIIGMSVAYLFFDTDILFRTPMSLAKSMHYKGFEQINAPELASELDYKFTPLYKGQRPRPKVYGVKVTARKSYDILGIARLDFSKTYWFKREKLLWREDVERNLLEIEKTIESMKSQHDKYNSMRKALEKR